MKQHSTVRDSAFVAERNFSRDRAGATTAEILGIFRRAVLSWLNNGDAADLAVARAAIEATLRDEFADIEREILNEIRREDG
jgi:hypothetical protein